MNGPELLHWATIIIGATCWTVLLCAAAVLAWHQYAAGQVGRELDREKSGKDWDATKADLHQIHNQKGKL